MKRFAFFFVLSLFFLIYILIIYLNSLQILLITLKAATPSVARFFVCVSLLFAGFMFCGYIVLGPFHPKVKLKFKFTSSSWQGWGDIVYSMLIIS